MVSHKFPKPTNHLSVLPMNNFLEDLLSSHAVDASNVQIYQDNASMTTSQHSHSSYVEAPPPPMYMEEISPRSVNRWSTLCDPCLPRSPELSRIRKQCRWAEGKKNALSSDLSLKAPHSSDSPTPGSPVRRKSAPLPVSRNAQQLLLISSPSSISSPTLRRSLSLMGPLVVSTLSLVEGDPIVWVIQLLEGRV